MTSQRFWRLVLRALVVALIVYLAYVVATLLIQVPSQAPSV
jgi:hypothetical protein